MLEGAFSVHQHGSFLSPRVSETQLERLCSRYTTTVTSLIKCAAWHFLLAIVKHSTVHALCNATRAS